MDRLNDVLKRAIARAQAVCSADGGERWAEIERQNREAEALKLAYEREARLDHAGVSLTADVHEAIVRGQPLSRQTRCLRAVQGWLNRTDRVPVLILSGGVGCGKSVAAKWAVANGPSSRKYLMAEDVVGRYAGGSFGDGAAEKERVRRCQLLVIDDLGTETNHGRMAACLIDLLEYRQSGRQTLITTNENMDALRAFYPDVRLFSRLDQSAMVVADDGPDLRRAPRA